MKSELERYRSIIGVDDEIIYADSCNVMLYKIVAMFNGGLTIEALTDNCSIPKNEHEDLYFHEMQFGWYLTKKTKINKKI